MIHGRTDNEIKNKGMHISQKKEMKSLQLLIFRMKSNQLQFFDIKF
jgi:hypothetical protein